MEIKSPAMAAVTQDVICDICCAGTRIPGYGLQYGQLEAQWGYGTQHDGEHYRVHLCENCFFRVLSGLRRDRMVNGMFDDDKPFSADWFGLISAENFGEGLMTEPVSVSGEAITDQSISETAKAGKVALTFFFGLTEKWGCSVAEQKLLLGLVSNATYYRYKKLTEARLSDDLIERISYLRKPWTSLSEFDVVHRYYCSGISVK